VTTAPAPAPTPPQGYWNGDGVPGSPKIVVSISDQRAYFYKGKHLVGESTVSTGKPGFGTPPGSYTVLWKHADHVSTVFGDYVDDFGNVVKSNIDSRKDSKPAGSHYDGARMPFAMFFRGGYAMHQGYVPPYAASHGCIRLPAGMAETFFNASPPGTPVIVKQEAVMHRAPVPAVDVQAPPAPYVVRSNAPPSVRPATVRSTVPLPGPSPIRSPGPVVHPASVRSTIPVPGPSPVRSPGPVVMSRPPIPVQSPAPLHSPSPGPLRSASPAPARSKTSTLSRSPGPVVSPTPGPVRSRGPVRLPAPSPTPTPRR
jgi:L,D-transpeptidase catalytic domain